MSERSSISWTDATWNVVTGCSRVSPGCEHCYAEALSHRRGWTTQPWGAQHAAENVVLHPERLTLPLHWKKPRKVFVCSMGDIFHECVPDEFLIGVLGVMALAERHTFQILTKRVSRMRDFFRTYPAPTSNVWLGVSVEDQRRANERILLLLETPAAVRFVSAEPLLGPVRFPASFLDGRCDHPCDSYLDRCPCPCVRGKPINPCIDWVIVGGESGRGCRPMDLDWARSLRDQCQAAGVAFFFKQSSGLYPGMRAELDGRVWHAFPEVRA